MRLLTLFALTSTLLSADPTLRLETRREPLPMGGKLWVSQDDGRVEITGWDKPEVELVAEFRDGRRGEKATLEVRKVSDGLEIEVKVPRRHHSLLAALFDHRSPVCNLQLHVPRKLSAVIRAVDGSIRVSQVDGYARCETVDGHIRLDSVSGEVHVKAVDGRIEARDLKARIKGSTVDGSITLERVEGGVDLKTVDGSIRAEQLDGWGEGITLATTDGNIDVVLGQAKGHLDTRTRDGAIHADAPGLQVEEQRRHYLKGFIPGSGQTIRLSTGDGRIRVH